MADLLVHTGTRTQIVFGEESTYKTKASALPPSNSILSDAGVILNNRRELPITAGESFANNIATHRSETLRADRMVSGVAKGQHSPGGSIPTELFLSGYNTLFHHCLAGKTPIYGSSPYYLSLYGYPDEPIGLTFEKQFIRENADPVFIMYRGCKVNGFELTIPTDGICTVNFDILAATEDAATDESSFVPAAAYGSPSIDNPLTALKLSSEDNFNGYVYLGVDGGSPADFALIQSARLTVTNNAQRVAVISSRNSYAIEFGRREISGEVQVVFTSATHYNYFVNNNDLELIFRFDADLTPAGGSEANQYMEFRLPKVRWGTPGGQSPTPVIDSDGPLSQTIGFEALRKESVTTAAGEANGDSGDAGNTDIVINYKVTAKSALVY